MRTRNERIQVRCQSMTFLNHMIEVIVRNEDYRAVKVKRAWDNLARFIVHQFAFGKPRNTAALSSIANCFEQIERSVIKENSIGIVENNNLTLFAVLIQKLDEASRADITFDNDVINTIGIPLSKSALNGKRFTQTSWARNNKRTRITDHTRLSQQIKNLETLGDAGVNLFIGLGIHCIVRNFDRSNLISSRGGVGLACICGTSHLVPFRLSQEVVYYIRRLKSTTK